MGVFEIGSHYIPVGLELEILLPLPAEFLGVQMCSTTLNFEADSHLKDPGQVPRFCISITLYPR